EDLLVRAGDESVARGVAAARMGAEARADRAHLEGRMHHSRAVFGADQGGVRSQCGPGEPAGRFGGRARDGRSAGGVATGGERGGVAWAADADDDGVAFVLRCVSARAAAGVADASAARLFRGAHVSAVRSRRDLSHELERMSLEKLAESLRKVAL